jgi:hypothetical protein
MEITCRHIELVKLLEQRKDHGNQMPLEGSTTTPSSDSPREPTNGTT